MRSIDLNTLSKEELIEKIYKARSLWTENQETIATLTEQVASMDSLLIEAKSGAEILENNYAMAGQRVGELEKEVAEKDEQLASYASLHANLSKVNDCITRHAADIKSMLKPCLPEKEDDE